MKAVLLFSDDANQRALAHRLAPHISLAAIILRSPNSRSINGPAANFARLARGILGLPLRKAWFAMLNHYDRMFRGFPIPPALSVSDINDPAVLAAVAEIGPDLVIVSGTNLLKRPFIELIGRTGKVLNLHTGISPYVRGGPNCTNWCLATGDFDLIGNTVMWIDAGIDSGNLVATEQSPRNGTESLTELHIKVMDHAHDLMVRCAAQFVAGRALPNVPQRDLGTGRLYLTRHWTAFAAARAVMNFYLRYGRQREPAGKPRLVDLNLSSPVAG